jgi:hypothetical protein
MHISPQGREFAPDLRRYIQTQDRNILQSIASKTDRSVKLLNGCVKSLNESVELLKESVMLQRIHFAIEQITEELRCRHGGRLDDGTLYYHPQVETPYHQRSDWNYGGRDPHEIREILYNFRQNCGRWIPHHATKEYRTSLQNEIYELVGVQPRLEHSDRDGKKQWCIWYS